MGIHLISFLVEGSTCHGMVLFIMQLQAHVHISTKQMGLLAVPRPDYTSCITSQS